jgi:hypothetical protein
MLVQQAAAPAVATALTFTTNCQTPAVPDTLAAFCCEQCCISADALLLQRHPQLLLNGQHECVHAGTIIQLQQHEQYNDRIGLWQ